MSIYKRAITALKRQAAKSVVLLLLTFLLGTVLAGAISVRNAIMTTEQSVIK